MMLFKEHDGHFAVLQRRGKELVWVNSKGG